MPDSAIAPKIFLLKAELPVNLLMTRNAVFTATQIAELLSLTPRNKYDLEVAVEEAFSNAVQHFSKDSVIDERIYLEFTIEDGFLVISVRENGIPFNMATANRFTPGDLQGMDNPGLGTFLMEQSMDSVEYFVHGRDGKETRLKKRISNAVIPEELVPMEIRRKGRNRPLVKEGICREATLEDLPEICRLAWKCYGYTQEDLLYNLELLTEKFKSNEIKPIIYIDKESGNMVAHEALKYHDPNIRVAELGLAFIDPSYRCPDISKSFAEAALQISIANGDRGLFDCSVTTHIYSQKASQTLLGSAPCGILIGIAASGMQAKELTTTKQEKGTVVNHYRAHDKSPHTVFIPQKHHGIVSSVYNWLELPRTLNSESEQPEGESSAITIPLPDELNVSFIVINKIGAGTLDEIKHALKDCRSKFQDAVYLFLPSGVSSSPYIAEHSEKLGFSFAGIMPHIHNDDDRFIMQWVNIDVDYSKIKVFGKRSAELLAYITAERDRIAQL